MIYERNWECGVCGGTVFYLTTLDKIMCKCGIYEPLADPNVNQNWKLVDVKHKEEIERLLIRHLTN